MYCMYLRKGTMKIKCYSITELKNKCCCWNSKTDMTTLKTPYFKLYVRVSKNAVRSTD